MTFTKANPCALCDWYDRGAGWGYLEHSPRLCVGNCTHVEGERRCDSCSEFWYRLGDPADQDEDGGPHEDCPQCCAENADPGPSRREVEDERAADNWRGE